MLDGVEILTTSGIVLWRRHYAPIPRSVVNSLVADVFIEDRRLQTGDTQQPPTSYRKDKYTLKWTRAKDVGLVFVAVYQSLLHLSWVDTLLTAVKTLFLKEYAPELAKPHLTKLDPARFDPTFDALVRKLDTGSTRRPSVPDSEGPGELTPPSSSASATEEAVDEPPPPPPPQPLFRKPTAPASQRDDTSTDATPVPTPDTSRPSTPASHLLTAKSGPGKASRRARKAQQSFGNSSAPASSGDESATGRAQAGKTGTAKAKRRWDADGFAVEGEEEVLDYSTAGATPSQADNAAGQREAADVPAVDSAQMGTRTPKGHFILKDLDDDISALLANPPHQQNHPPTQTTPSDPTLLTTATTKLTSLFQNILGNKSLTATDLRLPLAQMRTHLLAKNVAREAADRLCAAVEEDLLNRKTASFTTVDATLRQAMSSALTKILTPSSSLDLLRDVTATTTTTTGAGARPRPYVISIVGVNGVGKSTNLSKLAYFLLQNGFRVLVVAGDTFRAGAVEQLRVHVGNLSALARRGGGGSISLFERGYGKDAAAVAREAVGFAAGGTTTTANAGGGAGGVGLLFDVVLIDTAGRRHNDARLMGSLAKFSQWAHPDKVFMVGEALVGTDSVAQARNFAKEFVDGTGRLRNNGIGMDGFIISKCDTVGDMVGTLVSMVHATGIPVVFLGVGQHYGDLRGLNVGWAVERLMR
ncbi:hypothetical protein LTR08_000618 [Meristemomyces frigidus]|nr:hypothetical protein LTR08_000618 [Meristemomyces frigidus]